jgi:hypothetical protein
MAAADASQPEGAQRQVRVVEGTPARLLVVARNGLAHGAAGMGNVCSLMDTLLKTQLDPDQVKAARLLVEMVEAGWVAFVVKAVEAFGETHFDVFSTGCMLLCTMAHMRPRPPRLIGALITVVRVGVRAEPPGDPAQAALQLACLARGLRHVCAGDDAALRAAVVDAGLVEAFVRAGLDSDSRPVFLGVLVELCGPRTAASDDCMRRMIMAGGLGLAVAAVKAWKTEFEDENAFAGLALLDRLQTVALAATAPEKIVSVFQSQEDAIFDALLSGLAGTALAQEERASACIDALSPFAKSVAGGRCAPRRADRAVDAVITALRKMLPEHAASTQLASCCALALKVFAGGCSGDDAAAPGTRALCAGALPLLESMLPAVDAELVAGGLNKATRKQLAFIAEYVRLLRGVAAQREAAAVALIAEDEAQRAQRSKLAQAGKSKSSKAKKTKQLHSEVQQPTAALAAVSVADECAASAEPPAPLPVLPPPPRAPPPQREPPPPVLPPLPPPPPPQPQPVPATPPPLPPWLQQAMQQPPPRPPADAAAFVRGRARPAIAGLSAGEVPRELECAICLDAAAEGRTPCCGQTAFCAACAVTLRAECPLCRALPGAPA